MRSLRNAKESRNEGAAVRCAVVVFLIGTLLMISGISTTKVRAQTQQATGKFRRVENPIPNQYIVVLDDDVPGSVVASRAGEMTRNIGGRVGHIYRYALKGFSARMSEAAAIALSRDPQVEFVEEEARGTLDTTQTNPPWGLDRTDQTGSLTQFPIDHSYTYNETGSGVTAFVLGTGIRGTHVDFGNPSRVTFGADFVGDGQNGADCFGHETSVAGIVGGVTYGVAKNVSIINVRVCDCFGQCLSSSVIAGVDWSTGNANRPAVANASFGIQAGSAVDKAFRKSIAAGITYVASAGNFNLDVDASDRTPGRIRQAITVGATGNDAVGTDPVSDQKASFSNFGAALDLFAPGVKTPSASAADDTSPVDFGGTSASAPHVAGAVARYLQTDPTACPSTVSEVITSVANIGVVGNAGAGSPNRLLFAPLSWPSPTYYSLSLNGTTAYVDVADAGLGVKLDITGAIALEAWVFVNTIVEQTIVRKGGITDGGYALKLMGNGKVRFITYASPSSQENVTSNTVVTTGGWHHVAAVFDGTQKRIYLDGVLDKSQSSTFAPGSGTGHLSIGAAPDGTQPFSGLIDEVRLTADVVYTGSSFTPAHRLTGISGTRGLWRFDRQNAKDCADVNNGTIVGGATFSTSVP